MAVKEQQGRQLKHESGEGETERHDMHSATNLFHDTQSLSLEPRVCVMSVRNACNDLCRQKKCVRQQSVCTHTVARTIVATTWVRNPEKSSAQVHLGLSHQELVFHQDAFH